jgi:AbiTii
LNRREFNSLIFSIYGSACIVPRLLAARTVSSTDVTEVYKGASSLHYSRVLTHWLSRKGGEPVAAPAKPLNDTTEQHVESAGAFLAYHTFGKGPIMVILAGGPGYEAGYMTWANKELSSYADGDELPDYRVISASATGRFSGWGGSQAAFPIPSAVLEEAHRRFATEVCLTQAIAVCEDLVRTATTDGRITMHLARELRPLLPESHTVYSKDVSNRRVPRDTKTDRNALLSGLGMISV